MRPVAEPQSFLRNPLNHLLAAPANVRLLRVLASTEGAPIAASDIADHAGVTRAGVGRALSRLVDTGFVEKTGSGRSQQFVLRHDDPLVGQLMGLFEAERHRYGDLIGRLAGTLRTMPEIRTAWVHSVPEAPGEPLVIGLLAGSKSLPYLGEEVRRRLLDLEQRFNLNMEISSHSAADLPEVPWEEVEILAGYPVSKTAPVSEGGTHSDRTGRARHVDRWIAGRVGKDPTLVPRARAHIQRLLEEGPGMAEADLREWMGILEHYSTPRLEDFLRSTSDRAERLRQSSPFFAVLSADERERLFAWLDRDRDA